jgi:bifunctional UDP-N-acetylglucosamine pyrophosphorylase/glucosamine-1-phosphate N-acetyltransferase
MFVNNVRGVVLAAGKSSRFKTKKCKLSFTVCGQPMVVFPVKSLKDLDIPITVVLGERKDEVREVIEKSGLRNLDYVVQQGQLGTGDAVKASQETWNKDNILILNGDMPLVTQELLRELIFEHGRTNAVLTFLSAHCLNPFGYGRVIEHDGNISIVEEKNCTQEQRLVTLINAGVYIIKRSFLEKNLGKVKRNEVSGEYYVTDLVGIASDQGEKVHTVHVPYDSVRGVNTLEELWVAEQIKRSQMIKYWMSRGVRFELAQNIHLDLDIEIGEESFIGTGVHILKGTRIGNNCKINAFSIIENTIIDDNTHIHSHSVIQDSKIGKNVRVGPFARLRNNVVLGDNSNIGNFVEIKNTDIGDNTMTRHLTFLGDAQVGDNVNIGAGTITCNYDGVNKNKTVINDNSFIGSNNTLIAPVTVGKNSYTAAGSTISNDVPEDTLAIGRARQENKVGYVDTLKNRKMTGAKKCVSNKKTTSTHDIKLHFMGAVKTDDIQENV